MIFDPCPSRSLRARSPARASCRPTPRSILQTPLDCRVLNKDDSGFVGEQQHDDAGSFVKETHGHRRHGSEELGVLHVRSTLGSEQWHHNILGGNHYDLLVYLYYVYIYIYMHTHNTYIYIYIMYILYIYIYIHMLLGAGRAAGAGGGAAARARLRARRGGAAERARAAAFGD